MKKQTILKCLVIGVCVLSLVGCGTKQAEVQWEKDMTVTEQYQNDMPDTEDMSLNRDEKDSTAPKTNEANGNDNTEQPMPNDNGNTEQPIANKDASAEKQNNTTANNMGGKVDAGSPYSSAAMAGSVVEFSDGSCTVSADVTEEDGKACVSAAPGYESEDTNVVVTYHVTATKVIICHRTA